MDHMTSWFAGGAILGILASCWGYIKGVAWKVVSLFIQRVEVNGMHLPLVAHMHKTYKLSKVYDRVYGCQTAIVNIASSKCAEHHGYVPYEFLGQSMLIFWRGWWPIVYIRAVTKGKSYSGEEIIAGEHTSLMYLRWTFDIDYMISKAITAYNERAWSWDQQENGENRRFFIKYVPDFTSPLQKADDKVSPTNAISCSNLPWWQQDHYRLLAYDREVLGAKPRPGMKALERLIFPPNIVELIDEIKIWRENREWYYKRAIPWKRGWLLYGQPGSGKTALARAFAEDLDLPIFVFNLGEMSNVMFMRYWTEMQNSVPCIALIEDIDNVFHGRVNITPGYGGGGGFSMTHIRKLMGKKQSDKLATTIGSTGGASPTKDNADDPFDDFVGEGGKLTFDVFINMLDGINRSEGVFTIITTNHIEYIDEALGLPRRRTDGRVDFVSTRPGRIDKAIELTYMRPEDKYIMAKRILSDYADALSDLISILEFEGANNQETPAQFQDRCAQIALKCFWKEIKAQDIKKNGQLVHHPMGDRDWPKDQLVGLPAQLGKMPEK